MRCRGRERTRVSAAAYLDRTYSYGGNEAFILAGFEASSGVWTALLGLCSRPRHFSSPRNGDVIEYAFLKKPCWSFSFILSHMCFI